MKLSFQVYELKLKHPFTIARGSSTVRRTVLVRFEHQGIVGFGEAAPLARYHESPESVLDFLNKCRNPGSPDEFSPDRFLDAVEGVAPENYSAKASVDIAVHDWLAKKMSKPLWKQLCGVKREVPETSITIGIDNPEMIEKKVREAESFSVLKVKLGSPHDMEIMRTIRALTDKPIRVDGNEGWKEKELARDRIQWLEGQNVQFVEQPMPSAQFDDLVWLRERVELPLFADESVVQESDISVLSDAFDGINIKVMKCGGLREALRMIRRARSGGMKIMIGCMIETSVGISAGMSIAPLADYADLDGNILISNDPFQGTVDGLNILTLGDKPGLGVEPKVDLWPQR